MVTTPSGVMKKKFVADTARAWGLFGRERWAPGCFPEARKEV